MRRWGRDIGSPLNNQEGQSLTLDRAFSGTSSVMGVELITVGGEHELARSAGTALDH